MNIVSAAFAVFIDWPLLALVPAIAFFAAARRRGSWIALVAGLGWSAYAAYEASMRLRLLCSGECNIRVDLLWIYPVLSVMSVVAAFSLWRRGKLKA